MELNLAKPVEILDQEEVKTSINNSLEECRQKISMILSTNTDRNVTSVQSKTVVDTWPEQTRKTQPSKQTTVFETKQATDASIQNSIIMDRTSQILEKTVSQLVAYNRYLMERNMDFCIRLEKLENGQQEILSILKDFFCYMKDQNHSLSKPPENRNASHLLPANDFISGFQLASLYSQLNPQFMNMVSTLAATNIQQLNPGYVAPVIQIPQQTVIPHGVTQPPMNITQLDSLSLPSISNASRLESKFAPIVTQLKKPPISLTETSKGAQEEKVPSLANVYVPPLQKASTSTPKDSEPTSDSLSVKSQIPKDNLGDIFKAIPGSWICSICSLTVDPSKKACPACLAPKSNAVTPRLNDESVTQEAWATTEDNFNPKPLLFGYLKLPATGAFRFGFSNQSISANTHLSPISQQVEENAENSEDSALHDDDGDHIYFKPVLEKLPEKIEVVTGEENDEVLFCERAKLFRWFVSPNGGPGEWKERGLGPMKLLRDKETGKVRALMRRDQVHKVCLNHCVTAGMQLKPMPGAAAGKSWTWFALDYAESTEQPEKTTFCIRFKDVEQADRFGIEFNKAVEQRSPIKPAQVLANAEVNVTNSETHLSPSNTNSDRNSLTTEAEKDESNASKKVQIPDGSQKTVANNVPIFGSFTFSNTNKPLLNFSNLSNSTTIGFGQNSQAPFSWHGAGSQLFSSTNSKSNANVKENDGVEEDDSNANYDPHYEPIISLPSLVERKTGEEDEECLFVMRAKLYRFHNQQWKERGLGNMKVLKKVSDDSKCTARLLMRREQIHKICCNHAITDDCPKFTLFMNAKNAICWVASDFSEGSATTEQFCIKFKEESDLNKFVETVKNVQAQLS